jgi:hypothetical protein
MTSVVKIKRTSVSPLQWEGLTDDGRLVHARYRYGFLSVRLGPLQPTLSKKLLNETPLLHRELDKGLNGELSFKQLKEVTKGVIRWPSKEGQ